MKAGLTQWGVHLPAPKVVAGPHSLSLEAYGANKRGFWDVGRRHPVGGSAFGGERPHRSGCSGVLSCCYGSNLTYPCPVYSVRRRRFLLWRAPRRRRRAWPSSVDLLYHLFDGRISFESLATVSYTHLRA